MQGRKELKRRDMVTCVLGRESICRRKKMCRLAKVESGRLVIASSIAVRSDNAETYSHCPPTQGPFLASFNEPPGRYHGVGVLGMCTIIRRKGLS
jgi:hypothetical protein